MIYAFTDVRFTVEIPNRNKKLKLNCCSVSHSSCHGYNNYILDPRYYDKASSSWAEGIKEKPGKCKIFRGGGGNRYDIVDHGWWMKLP